MRDLTAGVPMPAPIAGGVEAPDGWGESALVLAEGGVRDRLVTELVMFGYRPLVSVSPGRAGNPHTRPRAIDRGRRSR